MSRHQYRHGRTLDALELRGFTLMQAKNTREGDTIGFLQPTFDYTVEAVESAPLDTIPVTGPKTTRCRAVTSRANGCTSSEPLQPQVRVPGVK